MGASLKSVGVDELTADVRCILVGVVGAFSPVCSEQHVPEFIARAAELERYGFEKIFCIAPNDPWTVSSWARQVDPARCLTFLSDGSLEFANWLGVAFCPDRSLFMGTRSRRYMILADHGRIERISVDDDPLTPVCTRATDLELKRAKAKAA